MDSFQLFNREVKTLDYLVLNIEKQTFVLAHSAFQIS